MPRPPQVQDASHRRLFCTTMTPARRFSQAALDWQICAWARTRPGPSLSHPKSATCLDRRREPGDLGSSGAERGRLARESAAVALVVEWPHRGLGPIGSPGPRWLARAPRPPLVLWRCGPLAWLARVRRAGRGDIAGAELRPG